MAVERPKKKYDEIMYGLIKDGEVFNCIVSSPEFADELQASGDYDAVILVGERERPSPGWKWSGGKWHRPEPEIAPTADIQEPPTAAPPPLQTNLSEEEAAAPAPGVPLDPNELPNPSTDNPLADSEPGSE